MCPSFSWDECCRCYYVEFMKLLIFGGRIGIIIEVYPLMWYRMHFGAMWNETCICLLQYIVRDPGRIAL